MERDLSESVDRLMEIQIEMLELLGEAESVIQEATSNGDSIILNRAQSYWLAHVKVALTKDHGFLAGSVVDMDDTIQELDSLVGDEDEEDGEDHQFQSYGGGE